MTQDERADVILAFRDSDFRLMHPNPKFHHETYHVVGRTGTPVEGVSLRFSTLPEGRELVWECQGHLAMPDVLTFATRQRVYGGAVLGGYASVHAHFRGTWAGMRRLDLLALCREAGVKEEQRAGWLEGARAYVRAFWQVVGPGPTVENAAD